MNTKNVFFIWFYENSLQTSSIDLFLIIFIFIQKQKTCTRKQYFLLASNWNCCLCQSLALQFSLHFTEFCVLCIMYWHSVFEYSNFSKFLFSIVLKISHYWIYPFAFIYCCCSCFCGKRFYSFWKILLEICFCFF